MCGEKWRGADHTLEFLLLLDGIEYQLEKGYSVKFEVRKVRKVPEIPHGVRYSLTMHDRFRMRVLGFDNAHRIRVFKPRFGSRKVTWDHVHAQGNTKIYEFVSASQLLIDFWEAVFEILKKR